MKGLLLVNLGTPDAPRAPEVRRYLREFLSDPLVIDLSPPARWALLQLVILPFRPSRSAEAYRKIWTEGGSPLLVHGRALAEAVAKELAAEYHVELGMRYGSPSVSSALAALRGRGVEELTVLPLYPQLSLSTTQSTVERVKGLLTSEWPGARAKWVPPFYASSGFLDAFAEVARPVLESGRPEQVLFSFHGLPVRQLRRMDPGGKHCLSSPSCCERISEANRGCYRAQAFETARRLAVRLELPPDRYGVSFQSRFGARWIEPFTDVRIRALARSGVGRLAVVCPAFVADCLETLEEIGIRGRESFLAEGGRELTLVPSLNAHPAWVRAVAELARNGGEPLQ
ncbi:MAG: ferrochelatase [Myxococcales bacterium]|nr:ferrochelatase [Myxococcales bacterium]